MKKINEETLQLANGNEVIADFEEDGKYIGTGSWQPTQNLVGIYDTETLQLANNENVICDVLDELGNYIGTEEWVLKEIIKF